MAEHSSAKAWPRTAQQRHGSAQPSKGMAAHSEALRSKGRAWPGRAPQSKGAAGPGNAEQRQSNKISNTKGNMTDEDRAIVFQMRVNGGSFASALADACCRADSENLARIKAAFPDLWAKYAAVARFAKSRPANKIPVDKKGGVA